MIDDLTRNILEQRDNIENQRNREVKSNEESYIKRLEQENQAYKEAIKRCYTPEEIDFEIMQVKAELEAEKDINNNLHKTIDKLRVNLYETQQQLDLYKEVIEEVREYNNQIIKDTKDFYRPTEDKIYSGDCLIDIAEQNISILDKAKGSDK